MLEIAKEIQNGQEMVLEKVVSIWGKNKLSSLTHTKNNSQVIKEWNVKDKILKFHRKLWAGKEFLKEIKIIDEVDYIKIKKSGPCIKVRGMINHMQQGIYFGKDYLSERKR